MRTEGEDASEDWYLRHWDQVGLESSRKLEDEVEEPSVSVFAAIQDPQQGAQCYWHATWLGRSFGSNQSAKASFAERYGGIEEGEERGYLRLVRRCRRKKPISLYS
jgi:hypothetical protein